MKTDRSDVLEIAKLLYQQKAQIFDLVAGLHGLEMLDEDETEDEIDEDEYMLKIQNLLDNPDDANMKALSTVYKSVSDTSDKLTKKYEITDQEIEDSLDADFREFEELMNQEDEDEL